MYYTNVLQIKNIYDFYEKSSSEQKHHIFTNSKELLEGDIKEDIKNLCIYLWENPNIIITLLTNSYNKDLDKYCIELITNRFYSNLISKNILQPQLFYIIAFFLNKEINELNFDKKNDFLKKTICHKIFKQLRRNPELIKYIRNIIKDIIKEVYNNSQSKFNEIYDIILSNKILLSIPMIEEKINEKKNEEKKCKEKNKNNKNIYFNKKFKNKNNINENEIEDVTKKYLKNITKLFLEEKYKEYKDNNKNTIMKEYCEVQLQNYGKFIKEVNNYELYTNNNLFKRISSSSTKEVDIVYKRNLILTIHFMNYFLNTLNEKINELPFQIRQICKLIKVLITKKFPLIKKFEINTFIGIFLFEKLLFPLFINPQLNCLLMTSKLTSEDFYYNLIAITRYIKCFFYGEFYFEYNNECDYTPFNYYFLEKMPFLNEIFDKICDVELPEYITQLILENENNTIDMNNINFNYLYKEKYHIYHQTFCLSYGDLFFIMKNIYMNQDKLFNQKQHSQLNTIWDKILKNKIYKEIIAGKALKENPIVQKKQENVNKKLPFEKEPHQIYEFMNNICTKPKIVKEYFIINNTIFNINEKNFQEEIQSLNKNFLTYDINNNNDLDILPIIKHSFCEILRSLPTFNELLSSNLINSNNINDFNSLIVELKKYFDYYYFNHMNFEQMTKSIQLRWALSFFAENENKLSNDFKENNYNLFYNNLEKDLNNSINNINNNIYFISHFQDNHINSTYNQHNIVFILSKLKKMNSNLILQKIIQKYFAYIQISVKINKNKTKNPKTQWSDLVFEIKKGKEKDDKWYNINNIYISEKNNYTNYKTIESFIDNFTFENEHFNSGENDNNDNINDNNNIFDYLYHLKIPEKINNYIDISIKELLLEKIYHDIYSKQEIPNYVSKIKKIMFCGLYDILYINYTPSSIDNTIYNKTNMLTWTKLSHFTNEEFPLHQSLIPPIVDCFKKLEKKKMPKIKLSYLIKINEMLSLIHCQKQISFNNKQLNNIYYLNPVLVYSIIKAKPKTLHSDIRYIEVFVDLKDKDINYIEEIKKYILFIIDMNYKDLYGNITEEEYNQKCNIYFSK